MNMVSNILTYINEMMLFIYNFFL